MKGKAGVRTYRVTASVGGWRSLPWPFGMLDVADDSLRVRSWHWSWWVPDRVLGRQTIEAIEVRTRLGTTELTVKVQDTRPVKLLAPASMVRIIDDLRHRGYPLIG